MFSCAVAIAIFTIFLAVIYGCNIDVKKSLIYLMIFVSIGTGKIVNDWLKTDNDNHGEKK